MSVDAWQPVPQITSIDSAALERLVSVAAQAAEGNLTTDLDWIQPFAQMNHSAWSPAIAQLDTDKMISLIKLFTMVEKQAGWDLAEKSAVIPLFKALRKEVGIDRALVQWVKDHTDNKFLPFGPLL